MQKRLESIELNVCYLSCAACMRVVHVVDDGMHSLFQKFIVFRGPALHSHPFSIRMLRMLQSTLHKKGSLAIPNDVRVQFELRSQWNDGNCEVNIGPRCQRC